MSKQLGDFQTPPALVTAVLESLGANGTIWPRVLEPACGCGNLIAGLLNLPTPPREIQAIELQTTHFQSAQKLAAKSSSTRVIIKNDKLFDVDFRRDLRWETTCSLLVVGNPPWVKNS